MGKSLLYILDKISLEREGLQPPKHHLSSFALRIPAGHLQEGMQSGWMVHRMSENVSRVRVSLNSLASHSVCVVQLLAALRYFWKKTEVGEWMVLHSDSMISFLSGKQTQQLATHTICKTQILMYTLKSRGFVSAKSLCPQRSAAY